MLNRRHFQMSLASLAASAGLGRWLSAAEGEASQWLSWRGKNRDGLVEAQDWPESLDENHLKELWEIPLDAGYSGPIVTSDRVFVTETQAEKMEVVQALSRTDGQTIWRSEWEGSMKVPFFAASNGSWIRSTPACDGQRLYVAGMRDVLVCLDVENGKEIWRVDFMKRYDTPLPDFGFVCSPLIDGDRLYVQAGGGLVCVDTKTGESVWRSLADGGGMNGSAFSSPVLATLHGRKQLVVQTRTKLTGIEPSDGSVIWEKTIEAFRGMNILTPTIWNDCIFTSSYGGKAWLYELEPSESGQWNVKQRWENKVQAYMSSPVVIDDYLYLHLRNKRLVCINMKDGTDQWTTRPFGDYWSMLSNGKMLLALDENGTLRLIKPNPAEYQLVSEQVISTEPSWAHIALAGENLYIRHLRGIKAFSWT